MALFVITTGNLPLYKLVIKGPLCSGSTLWKFLNRTDVTNSNVGKLTSIDKYAGIDEPLKGPTD